MQKRDLGHPGEIVCLWAKRTGFCETPNALMFLLSLRPSGCTLACGSEEKIFS